MKSQCDSPSGSGESTAAGAICEQLRIRREQAAAIAAGTETVPLHIAAVRLPRDAELVLALDDSEN